MSKIKLFLVFLISNIILIVFPLICFYLISRFNFSLDIAWFLYYLLIMPLLVNSIILFKFRVYDFSYVFMLFFTISSYFVSYYLGLFFVGEVIKNSNLI